MRSAEEDVNDDREDVEDAHDDEHALIPHGGDETPGDAASEPPRCST